MPPALFGLLLGMRYQRAESIHQRGDRRSDYPVPSVCGFHFANRYIETTGISAKTSGDVVVMPRVTTASIRSTDFSKRWMRPAPRLRRSATPNRLGSGEIYDGGKALSKYVKFLGTGTEKTSQSVVAW